jgi:hypothetical protein
VLKHSTTVDRATANRGLTLESARAATKGAGHENVTTYVGIDAHKKDLFIAMLVGDQKTPVTWTVPNEPNAVRRLVRNSSGRHPGRCARSTKPGRVAMPCNGS